jgi:TonB-dependent receptor
MQSYQLNGKHLIQPALNSRIEWRATRSLASQDEPDFREFNYLESENGQYENGGGWLHDPNRIYRFMEEDRNEYALDWIMPFKQWSGESGNVKFGGLTAHKNRDFNHRQYTYRTYNRDSDYSFNGAEGDIDTWLGWTGVVGTDTVAAGTPFETIKNEIGVTISENYFDVSEYDAEQDINAWYGMLDIPLITNFRMITGARFESTDMQVSAFDNSKDSLVVGSIVEDDILPSVNFIYGLSENMNIRVAYGKTLARPTFREMAPYFSYEVEGFYLNGNPELKRTLIDNFDVRWEWFTRPGEIYAVSVFRKNFDDPIERTFTNVNKYVQYQNVDEAEVTGLEVEARKRLDQINPALEYFQIGGNASFTSSSIDIPQTELQFIEQSTGRKVDTDRPFQGQSPYIFNANASYDNTESGTSTSFFYNVFGERLYSVSFSGTPDVYEMPRHTLNWTFSQRLMENLSFKAGVDNILDAERRFEYEDTFPGKTYVFRSYKTGRTISVGLSYKL